MTRDVAHEAGVRVEQDGAVAEITVGSGNRRNALTTESWRQLARCLDDIAEPGAVRAVVLRGAGDTFCAGSDLTEWRGADPAAVEESFAAMEAAFRAVERCPVPVVAEIRGVAAGAGCQLALACDLRVLADSARIGMPIARLGILASPAFAGRLVNLAGPALARELLYTGRLLRAADAVAVGLANTHVPAAELGDRVRRLVAEIVRQPAAAIVAAKRAVRHAGGALPAARPGPAVSFVDFQCGVSRFLGGTVAS